MYNMDCMFGLHIARSRKVVVTHNNGVLPCQGLSAYTMFPGSPALFVAMFCLQQNKQTLSSDVDALGTKLAQVRELGAAAQQLAADTRAILRTQAAARADATKVIPEHYQSPTCNTAPYIRKHQRRRKLR